MFKLIKKILIITILIFINISIYIAKIISDFLKENKNNFKKYSKSFYNVLKEELER